MFSMLLLLLGVGSALASDTWVKDSDPGYSYPRPLGVSGPVTIGDTFGMCCIQTLPLPIIYWMPKVVEELVLQAQAAVRTVIQVACPHHIQHI